MTDTQRCEPPEHLRGVDGWHWVQAPVGEPFFARWHPSERDDVEPLWTSTHHVYAGTPRYAAREWGWRYVAPATPPADVAALVEALERIADGDHPEGTSLAVNGNYRELEARLRAIARAALSAYRSQA